ncbi:MAG: DUF6776 family protein [Sulfuricella sp.]
MSFLRARRRKYHMALRRVAVRSHLAWYWRGAFVIIALGVVVALVWRLYVADGDLAGSEREASGEGVEQLKVRIRQLETENALLRSARVKYDRHTQIDTEAQKSLERDLGALQEENATLREELAFIRGMSSTDRSGALNIQRFTVKNARSGYYHFQLLVVQAGQKERVFRGRLQLVVKAQDGGGKHVLVFPGNTVEDDKFKINLKSYQSIEGDFQLAPGLVVTSVEARIFSEGSSQLKLSKLVSLS